MEKIVYGSKMKKVDNYTTEYVGIPSMVLMERAAYAVYEKLQRNTCEIKCFRCVCGVGNNGADGLALARMLQLAGHDVKAFVVGSETKATEQWRMQKKIALNCGVPVTFIGDEGVAEDENNAYSNDRCTLKAFSYEMENCDYLIDAIFGVGLSREVQGIYAEVIDIINSKRERTGDKRQGIMTFSLDVPSGLCADTGKVMGTAIKADTTYVFGALKTGLLLHDARDYVGENKVLDIGIPDAAYEKGLGKGELCFGFGFDDLWDIVPRLQHSNKGTYGKVLIIGGSKNVYGAAYFSAMSACKAGCGLVRVLTHENNRNLIYDKMPETMINVYSTGESESDIKAMVVEAVNWADVVVIGPGISTDREAEILLKCTMEQTQKGSKHIIIDADGLNIISEKPQLKQYYHDKTIITPHIGEASRLTGKSVQEISENIIAVATAYAHENNINIILKDSTTVILGIESSEDKCNNRVCINSNGNAGMATGGSGDVLTGIVAAVLAGSVDVKKMQEYKQLCNEGIAEAEREREKTFLSAAVAVYLHGGAGDRASSEYGETSMTATNILDNIPRMLNVL